MNFIIQIQPCFMQSVAYLEKPIIGDFYTCLEIKFQRDLSRLKNYD